MALRSAFLLCISLLLSAQLVYAEDAGVWAQYQQLIRARQYTSAAALIQPLAAQHNAEACYQLAQLHRSGTGVKEDAALSRRLLEDAASQGHVDSQYLLGTYYAKGIGGARDMEAARQYWQQAAEQHHARAEKALSQLGNTHHDGSTKRERILDAVRSGDLASLQRWSRQTDLTRIQDEHGNGLLSIAVQYNHPQCTNWLIAQNLGINHQNSFGETALHLAARQGDEAAVRQLLVKGAEPDQINVAGKTALHIAVEKLSPAIATSLLKHGADASLKDRAGLSAAELAQRAADPAMKRAFEQAGVAFSTATPAQLKLKAAKSLASDNESLFLAVERDNLELLTALLPTATPWKTNPQGHTLITIAALTPDSRCLPFLLQHNRQTGLIGPMERNALFYAIGSESNLNQLLKAGLSPEQKDEQGLSPVEFALDSGSPLAVLMIRAIPESHWQKAWLALAAEHGQIATLETLLQNNGMRGYWYEALKSALLHEQKTTANWLLQQKFDLAFVDDEGDTALHWLAVSPYTDLTQQILKRDASDSTLNALNQAGFSALHLASRAGQSGQVQLLIQNAADKDIKDKNGNTPLMLAVLANQPAVVRELLVAGADIGKRNINKQNALAMARQLRYSDIEELIVEASESKGILSIFD